MLLELENSDIRAQVQQAEANIGANTARLNEARQNLGRVKELQAGGVMSVADLDKAQAIHDALLADLAGARQALEEAKRIAMGFYRNQGSVLMVASLTGSPNRANAAAGRSYWRLYQPVELAVEKPRCGRWWPWVWSWSGLAG